jgi:thiamine pyrophosphate-dependent acetolactate synthase large subunit-like protein
LPPVWRARCGQGSADQGREDLPRAAEEGRGKGKAARIANAAAGSSKSAVGRKGGKSRSYDDWSKEDLVKRAKEVGIKGRSTMKKAELVKALRDH